MAEDDVAIQTFLMIAWGFCCLAHLLRMRADFLAEDDLFPKALSPLSTLFKDALLFCSLLQGINLNYKHEALLFI